MSVMSYESKTGNKSQQDGAFLRAACSGELEWPRPAASTRPIGTETRSTFAQPLQQNSARNNIIKIHRQARGRKVCNCVEIAIGSGERAPIETRDGREGRSQLTEPVVVC